MQTDQQEVMTKLKRVQKMFLKLTDQIEMLTTIIDQHKKPEPIVIDEADVELIISSPENVNEPQQEARKLLERFYYRINNKMEKSQVNQIEALRLLGKKNHHNDLYKNLFEGFKTLFFDNDQQCKVCKVKIKSEQLCIKHAKNEHLKDLKIYLCVKCKTTFQKLELLEKHINQEHSLKQRGFLIQKQNQKLDITQFNIQSQPILKKVLVPNKHSDSGKQESIFNQVYTGVENLESQKNIEEIIQPKKKLKIKILAPEINEGRTRN